MVDDIISYREMCDRLRVNAIQKGMNYHIRKDLSVILMSVRENAPYEDEIDEKRNLLIYEGHDVPRTDRFMNPKEIDQPMSTEKGSLTENGKFYEAAQRFKNRESLPERVAVFEKLRSGIWCDKGVFELVDAGIVKNKGRNVFKF
jgi:hypothetical protein